MCYLITQEKPKKQYKNGKKENYKNLNKEKYIFLKTLKIMLSKFLNSCKTHKIIKINYKFIIA